jgi:hypothetical protein
LWRSLAVPVIVAISLLILIIYTDKTNLRTLALVCGALLLVDLLWAVWEWIDWGNDYCIVTNQRAVWLEKEIVVYDSRQEAPLTAIQSEDVDTGLIGRWLDYGDVILRTYIGRVTFRYVHHPYQAKYLVSELRARTKEVSRRTEVETMKHAIRQRLGLPTQQSVETAMPVKASIRPPYKPSPWQKMFTNIFTLRFEDSDSITYRKHWFVLIEQTWKPGILFLILLVLFIYSLSNSSKLSLTVLPSNMVGLLGSIPVILGMLLVGAFLWWLYQYVDWRNDIFKVTLDQILDIDKKPLGREEYKAAPLENILGTEYKRIGLLRILFNFGTVYITIGGGAPMAFEDVLDPAGVEQDINRRRVDRINRKDEARITTDRERLADWFAAYHRNAEEFRREEEERNSSESDVK